MTIDELIYYVNNLSPASSPTSNYSVTPDDTIQAIRGFIAIAALFVKQDYPGAAELVLHALSDEDYYETDGLFTERIKRSTTFLNWVPNATTAKEVLYFPPLTPAESMDLFYFFRHATFSSPYTTTEGKVIYCFDQFDFRGQQAAETLRATVLNEGAWLLTQLGVMYPIDVHISFVY